jgi:hypothetical protein
VGDSEAVNWDRRRPLVDHADDMVKRTSARLRIYDVLAQ